MSPYVRPLPHIESKRETDPAKGLLSRVLLGTVIKPCEPLVVRSLGAMMKGGTPLLRVSGQCNEAKIYNGVWNNLQGIVLVHDFQRATAEAATDLFRGADLRLSYPELVHARESRWVLHLKIMPKRQVGHRPVCGKTSSEILQHAARQMEPKEVELILPNKLVDLR
jgi:hypothetical protein